MRYEQKKGLRKMAVTPEHDLKNKMKFKEVIDLKNYTEPQIMEFKGDIAGQIVTTEKGNDIVVTAYNTQKVTYQKVETIYNTEKIKSGKNKNKYACTTLTYKAILDEDGNVTGYEDEPSGTKITYVKKLSSNSIEYQILNAKNKIIETSSEAMLDANEIIVDKGSVLGTVTYKNGNLTPDGAQVSITGDINTNDIENILTHVYAPVKSKNTYKGSWLNEEVSSSSKNETFTLGTGENTINFDMKEKQGKDTVNLVKDGKFVLNFNNADDVTSTYARSGNNIVIKESTAPDFAGDQYSKCVLVITKSGSKYDVVSTLYSWNDETGEYDIPSEPSSWSWSAAEFKEVQESYKKYEGINLVVGTNSWYQDSDYNIYTATGENIGQITLKNYLKNAQDNVFIGGNSLKEILEDTVGVGIFGNKDATKKQKLNGTFLNEKIYGGNKNDTIKTGSGNDIVYVSSGKDTISIDGDGAKIINYVGDDFKLGNTEISFKKGLNYGLTEGRTSLDISKIYNKSGLDTYLVKSGNNLIIESDFEKMFENRYEGGKNNLSGSKVAIKDFFKNEDITKNTIFAYDDETTETIDDIETTLLQVGNLKKANKLSDTKYNDMLLGGKKADKFTVSNGNTQIIADAGNDTINVTKDAKNMLNVIRVVGDGNDVLNIDKDAQVSAIVDGMASRHYGTNAAQISFEKTGDNLIFKTQYAAGETFGLKKAVTDSLTVSNYFGNGYNLDVDFVYGFDGEEYLMGNVGEILSAKNMLLQINSTYDKKTKINNFVGTNLNDEYAYSGKGKAEMLDESLTSNDKYNLTINKNSNLKIADAGGDDTVVFSDANNLRLFFDVIIEKGENNEILSKATGAQLLMFDKDAFTAKNTKNAILGNGISGAVEFSNYFEGRAEDSSYTMKTATDPKISVDFWAGDIKEEVAAWLATTEYNSAIAVLESKDTQSINTLLAFYNKGYYDIAE